MRERENEREREGVTLANEVMIRRELRESVLVL